jgi:1,2-dihydroxy-3-keto-5-methylthiopentene dioxygenase
MAILTFSGSDRTVQDREGVQRILHEAGIVFEVWGANRLPRSLGARNLSDAEKQAVLAEFAGEIALLNRTRGYTTADVVTLYPDTPDLDALLAKFDRRHTHSDDEVRFIAQGSGTFHLCPSTGPHAGQVIRAEVHPGDFLLVPKGYPHWFTLGPDRQITAVRLFTDPAGWVAHYC